LLEKRSSKMIVNQAMAVLDDENEKYVKAKIGF